MVWIILVIIAIIIWLIWRHYKKSTLRYVDSNGYERDGYNKLIHRKIAYRQLYNYPEEHTERFGSYDVHHRDRNKRNNSPENLKILTRDEHKAEHGIKYIDY